MKDIFGIIGFFITAMLTFRLVYGAWPPSEGNLGNWLSSEPKAIWSMGVAITAGMVGALIGRAFSKVLNKQEGRISSAYEFVKRGFRYHRQRKLLEAINMFKQAIEIYTESGCIDETAPVYGSLGKAYFDKGDLDLAESTLNKALTIYRNRPNAQEAIDTLNVLLQLISERKQDSDSPSTYKNVEYEFSFIIPSGWLKQKLVPQFVITGGQIAISHISHKATFNVSVGPPDQVEFAIKDARANAVRVFLAQASGRIGAVTVSTSTQVGGQSNTVYAEYVDQHDINGVFLKRKNGFISIIHNELEYAIQWSAMREYEDQVNKIIASFRFGV